MGGGAEAGESGEIARDCIVTPVRIVSLFHPHHSLYCLGVPMGGALPSKQQVFRSAWNDKPLRAYATYFHYRD
jgi:hypothetical protein